MKMISHKKLLVIILIIIFNNSYSQSYLIEVKKLNVREYPDKNSRVIGSYSKNDTVNIISQEGNWLKLKIDQKEGYINKTYVKKQKSFVDKNIKKGFITSFKKVFFKSFIIVFFIFLLYQSYKRRITDSRYKNGYRQGKITIREHLTYGIYSLIISLILGIVCGIKSWISTF